MLNELDVVNLKRSIPELGLIEGARGTIVMVYSNSPGFEVEFCDSSGRTLLTHVLQESDLERLNG